MIDSNDDMLRKLQEFIDQQQKGQADPLERDALMDAEDINEPACHKNGEHVKHTGPIPELAEEWKAQVLPHLHKAHAACCKLGIPIITIAQVNDEGRHGILATQMRQEMAGLLKAVYALLTTNPGRILSHVGPIVSHAISEIVGQIMKDLPIDGPGETFEPGPELGDDFFKN